MAATKRDKEYESGVSLRAGVSSAGMVRYYYWLVAVQCLTLNKFTTFKRIGLTIT